MTITVRNYAGQWLSLMALQVYVTALKSIFSVTGNQSSDMLPERLAYRPCFNLPLVNMRPFSDDHLESLGMSNSSVFIVDNMLLT